MISWILKLLRKTFWTTLARNRVSTYGDGLTVNFKSRFTKFVELGNNNNFNGIKVKGKGSVSIGDNFHSGENLLIITDIHNYEGNRIPYDDTYIVKNVQIGDNVWVGDNVTILAGVNIGEGAIIQAGSVVVKNIEPFAIAGGHPAIKFSSRNINHYLELKRKGLFH